MNSNLLQSCIYRIVLLNSSCVSSKEGTECSDARSVSYDVNVIPEDGSGRYDPDIFLDVWIGTYDCSDSFEGKFDISLGKIPVNREGTKIEYNCCTTHFQGYEGIVSGNSINVNSNFKLSNFSNPAACGGGGVYEGTTELKAIYVLSGSELKATNWI